ncbi:hypothetical protein V6N13_086652 [Hibiscus sabdariffa]|uniref:Uncharacterized protein n=1 Tax=Hibiscus sabdariffa TaxID=183260 RepID=A0ABR2FTW3_9ROSI
MDSNIILIVPPISGFQDWQRCYADTESKPSCTFADSVWHDCMELAIALRIYLASWFAFQVLECFLIQSSTYEDIRETGLFS